MKRSCSVVPQRTKRPSSGLFHNRAISARTSSCCARLMRALGGISKPRNSTSPSRPVGPSGEYSLSMQISERCVLPVTSVSRLRNKRSTNHGNGGVPCPGGGTCAMAISSSYRLSWRASSKRGAWLVGPDEEAGKQIGQ